MRRVVPAAVIIAVLAGTGAGVPAGESTLRVKGADLDLLTEIRALARQVEQIRSVKFPSPPLAVRAPAEIQAVAAEIRAGALLPRERLEARGRAWADLGLGDPGSPRLLLAFLAADQGGVSEDPEGRRLLVAPGRLSAEDFGPKERLDPGGELMLEAGVHPDEPLAVHHLVHLLQRQRTGEDHLRSTTDATLAASAWAEGEANLVAVRFLFRAMGLEDAVVRLKIDPGEVLQGELLPPGLNGLPGALRWMADFVYRDGYDSAAAAYVKLGWTGLDKEAAERRTTSAILHPKRPPRAGRPPEPARPTVLSDSYRLADHDVLGELVVVALVATLTGKDNLGLMAGDGWDGDRLERWEAPGEPVERGVTVWRTRWVTGDEAEDFADSMGRAIGGLPGAVSEGAVGGTGRRFARDGRVYLIERRKDQVTLSILPESLAPSRNAGGR